MPFTLYLFVAAIAFCAIVVACVYATVEDGDRLDEMGMVDIFTLALVGGALWPFLVVVGPVIAGGALAMLALERRALQRKEMREGDK